MLYDSAASCICINRKITDWFPISATINQSCVAPPSPPFTQLYHWPPCGCSVRPLPWCFAWGLRPNQPGLYQPNTVLLLKLGGEWGYSACSLRRQQDLECMSIGWSQCMWKTASPDQLFIILKNNPIEWHIFHILQLRSFQHVNLHMQINRRCELVAGVMRGHWSPPW